MVKLSGVNAHFRRTLRSSVSSGCLCAFLATVHIPQANAQVADTQASTADGADIVVTARRRSELLQDVPISISAFDTSALENRSVNTFADLQHLIPSLHYVERGNLQTELTIRGIGGDARNAGIDSGVGMYVDEAYVPRTSGYNADLADIAQVEVLRGPQGTLFGKNTIAGVINITTKKPGDQVEGSFYASYGNYNAIRTKASVATPLGSGLSAKVTVATWDRDGYIYNRQTDEYFNNEDRRGGRLQLRYNPDAALDVNLSVDATRDRRLGVLNQIGSAAGAAAPYFTGNRFIMAADQRNSDSRDMWGATLGVDYVLPNDMAIKSIGAYRSINILVYSDIDQTPLDTFHSGPFTDITEMYSQELRLISAPDKAIRYVVGLFYYHQEVESDRNVFINGARAVTQNTSAYTDSYAAYTNVDVDLSSSMTFTGGLRYSVDKKSGQFDQVRRPNLDYSLPLRRKDNNISWTTSLLYKINPRLSAYATGSRGFKSGGFNLDPPSATGLIAQDFNFLPEKVTNYEIGIKGRPLDWARLSLSAFFIDYTNKQVVQITSPAQSNFPIALVTNAGQAEIKGMEADVTITPLPGLTVGGTLSYLDAKYTNFQNAALVAGQFVSYTGNRIERTPRWAWTANAEYRLPVRSGQVIVSGILSHQGAVFF